MCVDNLFFQNMYSQMVVDSRNDSFSLSFEGFLTHKSNFLSEFRSCPTWRSLLPFLWVSLFLPSRWGYRYFCWFFFCFDRQWFLSEGDDFWSFLFCFSFKWRGISYLLFPYVHVGNRRMGLTCHQHRKLLLFCNGYGYF